MTKTTSDTATGREHRQQHDRQEPDARQQTAQAGENADRSYQNRLYPEDQEKVDAFLRRGVNSVERKPFKPMRMMILLIVVVTTLSLFSQLLARWAGVY
ncbi:MAG: DUF3094 family protein [Halioglobus sp.]|nr:DUF3094 family protein [Halioglobus sp.]